MFAQGFSRLQQATSLTHAAKFDVTRTQDTDLGGSHSPEDPTPVST
jgi:hypothetical protein